MFLDSRAICRGSRQRSLEAHRQKTGYNNLVSIEALYCSKLVFLSYWPTWLLSGDGFSCLNISETEIQWRQTCVFFHDATGYHGVWYSITFYLTVCLSTQEMFPMTLIFNRKGEFGRQWGKQISRAWEGLTSIMNSRPLHPRPFSVILYILQVQNIKLQLRRETIYVSFCPRGRSLISPLVLEATLLLFQVQIWHEWKRSLLVNFWLFQTQKQVSSNHDTYKQ